MSCKITGDQTIISVKEFSGDCNDLATASPANDTGFNAIGCCYDLQPTGHNYDTITADECLEDTGDPTTDLSTEQADTVVFSHAYCPGGTAGFGANQSATEQLRTYAQNKTLLLFRIEYRNNPNAPAGKKTYEKFCGKIQTFKPDTISKREFMRLPITVLRTGQVVMQSEP